MKEIWFIRHAESEGNAGKPTNNTKYNPLSKKGLDQADDLTTHLYFSDEPDLIVHSKYKRAIQTMKPYTDNYPSIPVEEWNVHEFTYLCNKKYTNTTEKDRSSAREEYWTRCDHGYVDGEGAECFSDFRLRAQDAFEKAACHPAKLIYVYSHGWFIKMVWWMLNNQNFRDVLYKNWNDETMEEIYKFFLTTPFPNTGILKVKIDHEGTWLSTWS